MFHQQVSHIMPPRHTGFIASIGRVCWYSIALVCIALTISSADELADESTLSDMTLEALLGTKVTSVSKRAQKLFDSAAAIYVITQEDIRRSGMSNIPDVLRLAPGMQVGKLGASDWSIGSRGFNDFFSNKLLVLLDGRSLYTPLFSGVWWNIQDVTMADIDRIEIIRGPGATLWGANAVNGVINIITKSSAQTHGGLAYTGYAGSDQTQQQGMRYGGQLANGMNYRFYVKSFTNGSSENAAGASNSDDLNEHHGGFRVDWSKSASESVTVQGDTYGASVEKPDDRSGSNLIFRQEKTTSDSSSSTLQVYYDRTRMISDSLGGEIRQTYDFDYQHSLGQAPGSQWIWGLGYRHMISSLSDGQYLTFNESERTDRLFSGFVQHDEDLKPDLLRLTTGVKIEHNDFTGFEVQPNVRLVWTPSANRTMWAAVSRAARTPSIVDYTPARFASGVATGPGGISIVSQIAGDPGFTSEHVLAHELGYRMEAAKGLFLDIAGFYNVYRDLRSFEPTAPQMMPGTPPYMLMTMLVDNQLSGTSHGLEVAADWTVTRTWKVAATCSWIDVSLDRSASHDPSTANFEHLAPSNAFSLRSHWTLPDSTELDAMFYHTGSCISPSTTGTGSAIPAYNRLDLRVGRDLGRDYTMSVGVRNALSARHEEAGSVFGSPAQLLRHYYCTLSRLF